jgi:hypothetical protein
MPQPAWMKKLKQMNPYGSLGPSPGTVTRVNATLPGTPAATITASPGWSSWAPQQQTPNWAALVAGDPDYEAAESEFNKMNLFDRGSLRDAIRRAVIESGLDVGQDEDIDAGTVAAAKANQFSSAADINNQLRRGAASSDAELAARGILSSGQFTENRSVLQKGADTARNSLQGALLDTIRGGRDQYTSKVADRRMQLRALKESIAARLAQNPGVWGQNKSPVADPFSPLANASAQQMWQALQSTPAARKANAGMIAQGFDAFLRNYGSQFGGGGGGGAAPPAYGGQPSGGGGAPQIVRYGWENGVQYGYDAAGRKYSAGQLGAKF